MSEGEREGREAEKEAMGTTVRAARRGRGTGV